MKTISSVVRIFADAVLVLAAAAILFLAVRNTVFRQPAETPALGLQSGDVLPPLAFANGVGSDTSNTMFPRDQNSYLIMVFLYTCPACKQIGPTWDSVASEAARHGVSTVAVTSDTRESAQAWLKEHQVETLLLAQSTAELALQWRIQAVPTTMLVREGRIVSLKVGVLNERDTGELLQHIRAKSTQSGMVL